MWVNAYREDKVDVLPPRCLPSLIEKKVNCIPHSMLVFSSLKKAVNSTCHGHSLSHSVIFSGTCKLQGQITTVLM